VNAQSFALDTQMPLDMSTLAPDVDTIRRSLQRRYTPGQLIELRVPGVTMDNHTVVLGGLYTDQEKLTADIVHIAETTAPAIYTGLQEIKNEAAYQALVTNDFAAGRGGAGATEIQRYVRLLIDVDPIRAKGFESSSSSDAEKISAREVIDAVIDYLGGQFEIYGDLIDSGNGFHFLPALNLDATPANETLIKKVLDALAARFDTPDAKIDTCVSDRARICKLPGTVARKGISTPEHPHRVSKVLSESKWLAPIPQAYLLEIAGLKEVPKSVVQVAAPSEEVRDSMDFLYGFLDWAGISYGAEKSHEGGIVVVLKSHCPFQDHGGHHAGEAHCGVNIEAKLCFACKHDTCRGVRGWKEFRAEVERQRGDAYCHGLSLTPPAPTTTATPATATTPASAASAPEQGTIIANWRASFRTVGELEDGDIKMLVDGFMPHGMNFIGALPGEAKTLFALSITRALTTGRPLLGNPQWTIPAITPVIYMIPEVGARAFKKRLTKFQIPSDENLFICRTISEGGTLRLSDPILQEAVKVLKPVVILDTLIRFSEADDENASIQNKKLGDDIIELLHLGAVSVISLHHAAKSMRNDGMTLENILRGTGDLAAMADVVYGLKRDDKLYDSGAGPLEVEVRCLKPRDLEHPPLPFRMAASRKMEGRDPNSLAGEVGMSMGIESVINASGDFVLVGQSAKQARFETQLAEAIADDPRITITQLSKALGENCTKIQRMLTHLGWVKPKAGPIAGRIWTRSNGQCSQGSGQSPVDDDEEIPDFPSIVN
jgi:hypothetical protein